jgi:hypothetical protein
MVTAGSQLLPMVDRKSKSRGACLTETAKCDTAYVRVDKTFFTVTGICE